LVFTYGPSKEICKFVKSNTGCFVMRLESVVEAGAPRGKTTAGREAGARTEVEGTLGNEGRGTGLFLVYILTLASGMT
jgi:hypothetical protein